MALRGHSVMHTPHPLQKSMLIDRLDFSTITAISGQ
jgi:hypothetical protein